MLSGGSEERTYVLISSIIIKIGLYELLLEEGYKDFS
jgi:hypothetical protein